MSGLAELLLYLFAAIGKIVLFGASCALAYCIWDLANESCRASRERAKRLDGWRSKP